MSFAAWWAQLAARLIRLPVIVRSRPPALLAKAGRSGGRDRIVPAVPDQAGHGQIRRGIAAADDARGIGDAAVEPGAALGGGQVEIRIGDADRDGLGGDDDIAGRRRGGGDGREGGGGAGCGGEGNGTQGHLTHSCSARGRPSVRVRGPGDRAGDHRHRGRSPVLADPGRACRSVSIMMEFVSANARPVRRTAAPVRPETGNRPRTGSLGGQGESSNART